MSRSFRKAAMGVDEILGVSRDISCFQGGLKGRFQRISRAFRSHQGVSKRFHGAQIGSGNSG